MGYLQFCWADNWYFLWFSMVDETFSFRFFSCADFALNSFSIFIFNEYSTTGSGLFSSAVCLLIAFSDTLDKSRLCYIWQHTVVLCCRGGCEFHFIFLFSFYFEPRRRTNGWRIVIVP